MQAVISTGIIIKDGGDFYLLLSPKRLKDLAARGVSPSVWLLVDN